MKIDMYIDAYISTREPSTTHTHTHMVATPPSSGQVKSIRNVQGTLTHQVRKKDPAFGTHSFLWIAMV